jgi:hypothetical protein
MKTYILHDVSLFATLAQEIHFTPEYNMAPSRRKFQAR